MQKIFLKNLVLIALFFIFTPVAIGTSIFTLNFIEEDKKVESKKNQEVSTFTTAALPGGAKVYASVPSKTPKILGVATASDARAETIRQYLSDYDSPLEPFAEEIVLAADINDIDFRLLTAIAHKESGLCKAIPPGSHNCWGWGIHSKGTLTFDSYEEAIMTVTQGLKEKYIDLGYVTPEEIMSKYIPHSDSWAADVEMYLERIDNTFEPSE